jgi:arginyl-tRNA--protein-N-Asp/Glu arginylyltransferase
MIAYRPACDGCSACVSVRIVVADFVPSRSQKRILRRNADLVRQRVSAEATREQFALLRAYLDSRHAGGGMSDMGLFDYVAMVEETPVDTHIVEYRRPSADDQPDALLGCALTDVLRDGLSMVYSFFHPGAIGRSIGSHMILDHVEEARARGLPYVYLGYWIQGSDKMDYKHSRFQPLEALGPEGWARLAGALVHRFDVRYVLAAGLALWAGATALSGLAQSFAMLLGLRFLVGFGESVIFPANARIIACMPNDMRGSANGLISAGMALGPSLGTLAGGLILAHWGWRAVFVALGGLSLLWLPPWLRVSKVQTPGGDNHADVPTFAEILRQRSLWGASIGHFCGNYPYYLMLTWMTGHDKMREQMHEDSAPCARRRPPDRDRS